MSDNRFVLGAGVGWMKEEFDAYGVDFHTRGKRYDECIDSIRQLWTGEWTEYRGEHINFDSLRILPAPTRTVPIFLGGSSKIALRRCARIADGFIGNGNSSAEVPELLGYLNGLRKKAGRADLPFESVMGLTDAPSVETYKRLGDCGMTAGVNAPFAFTVGWKSTIEQKIAQMEQFADEFIRPLSDD